MTRIVKRRPQIPEGAELVYSGSATEVYSNGFDIPTIQAGNVSLSAKHLKLLCQSQKIPESSFVEVYAKGSDVYIITDERKPETIH